MVSFTLVSNNPFGLRNVGSNVSTPTFADIDSDGDTDAFIGDLDGNITFFQNTGRPNSPKFAAPQVNPLGLEPAGIYSTPTFADIDKDGDMDAFVGYQSGNIRFYQNTGSPSSPDFATLGDNLFGLSNVNGFSSPTFTDIDSDGDLDAFIGYAGGGINFYQNTGSPNSPKFAAPVANPFGLSNLVEGYHPTFADIDEDGDMDAFIGYQDGNTSFYQNTGSPSSPKFAAPVTNPFGLSGVWGFSAPTFADIDSDGDLDAFIGNNLGDTAFFLNTTSVDALPPLSGAGGQQQFTVISGNGTVVAIDFGGVGSGVNPAATTIEEVDTLQFTGAGLTP